MKSALFSDSVYRPTRLGVLEAMTSLVYNVRAGIYIQTLYWRSLSYHAAADRTDCRSRATRARL